MIYIKLTKSSELKEFNDWNKCLVFCISIMKAMFKVCSCSTQLSMTLLIDVNKARINYVSRSNHQSKSFIFLVFFQMTTIISTVAFITRINFTLR